MKNRITHVAVMSLVLTAVFPGEVVAQQQRSYDRFKDRTSYEAKVELSELSKTSRGISLSLQSVVDGGRAVTKSDSFTVSAIVTFNMSYDVRCAGTGFDMLVDGRAGAALPARIRVRDLSEDRLPHSKNALFAKGWSLQRLTSEELDAVALRMAG